MTIRRFSIALFAAALLASAVADRPLPRPVLVLGGYRVLAADFHLHSSTWSDGGLTPWGLVLEAERQGLDVIAITGHNQISDSEAGQWFATRVGGPMVLIGEEIHTPGHHVIAVGIHRVVDFRRPVADQIDDVHAQGGVAIAAHPVKASTRYDARAIAHLDGAEICHPVIFGDDEARAALERFATLAPMAAIGSSDFHGFGRMGACRTYVFARDDTPESVLDALRAHRTVVYGTGGKVYGDPALVRLASTHPELAEAATVDAPVGWLEWLSRVCGVAGLGGMVLRRKTVGTPQ